MLGKLKEFHAAIFAWPVFFRTALTCFGGNHLERCGMQLHDAVGINCKKCATTEIQGEDFKYIVKVVYVDDCVGVI